MQRDVLKNKWVLGLRLCFYAALWAFDAAVILSRWQDSSLGRRAFGVMFLVLLPVLIYQQAQQLNRLMARPAQERA